MLDFLVLHFEKQAYGMICVGINPVAFLTVNKLYTFHQTQQIGYI
jgi:hypothetical protein